MTGDVPSIAALSAALLPVAAGSHHPSDMVTACRANTKFDAHKDDPDLARGLIADEARDAGKPMSDRTAWKVASN